MNEEETAKLFFEFLKHMSNLTDIIESMAHKMEEMEMRISTLENNNRNNGNKFTDDEGLEWVRV